jgi:hypothetical protein
LGRTWPSEFFGEQQYPPLGAAYAGRSKRMEARTIEMNASHLSLISHPDEITRLIPEAAGQQA